MKEINDFMNKPITRESVDGFQDFSKLPSDFTSEIKTNGLESTIKVPKGLETLAKNKHRSQGKRKIKLGNKMDKWKHKEQLVKKEPAGCGFPICVEIDMIPYRFKSLCAFAEYLAKSGHSNRVFMVQKGACEQASKSIVYSIF